MDPEMPPGVSLGKSKTSDHRYILYLEATPDSNCPVPKVDLRFQGDPFRLSGRIQQQGTFGICVTVHELPRYASLLARLLRIQPDFEAGDHIEADADICARLTPRETAPYLAQYMHVFLDLPVTLTLGNRQVELPLPRNPFEN